jgi:hypothetical protein
MLRGIIVATLLAITAVLSEPAKSADTQSSAGGIALTGKDDSENPVTADLHGQTIAVQLKDNACGTPWYVHTGTSTAPALGMHEPLISCKIYFCTRDKLKKQCKGQSEWFSVDCMGTWSAEPGGLFRLDVNYLDEYWEGAPKCRLKKTKDKKSVVFLLKRPPQAGTQGPALPSMSDLTNCAVHAYLPGDHPLHGEGCK